MNMSPGSGSCSTSSREGEQDAQAGADGDHGAGQQRHDGLEGDDPPKHGDRRTGQPPALTLTARLQPAMGNVASTTTSASCTE
jgi:hypothetical protein